MGFVVGIHMEWLEIAGAIIVAVLVYRYLFVDQSGTLEGGKLTIRDIVLPDPQCNSSPANGATVTLSPNGRWLGFQAQQAFNFVLYDLVHRKRHIIDCGHGTGWNGDRLIWTPSGREAYLFTIDRSQVRRVTLDDTPTIENLNSATVPPEFLNKLTCSDARVMVHQATKQAASPRPSAEIDDGALQFFVEPRGRFKDLILLQYGRRTRVARHRPPIFSKGVEIEAIYPSPTGTAVVYSIRPVWLRCGGWYVVNLQARSKPVHILESLEGEQAFTWSADGRRAYCPSHWGTTKELTVGI